jgi:hypothetical protein
MKRPRIDVNLSELDQLLDQAQQAPLSEPDCRKIKTTLHLLVEMLVAKRTTEKTRTVVDPAAGETAAEEPAASAGKKTNGHGRTPASAYTGASKAIVAASGAQARRRVPGMHQGKGVRAKGTPAAGANRGTSAVGGHRL